MAQAASSPPRKTCTPFPSPPGLEVASIGPQGGSAGVAAVAEEVRAAAFRAVEERLMECADTSQQVVIEAIRDAVIRDVDARVAEKADELWHRGKQMLSQMQQKHKERTSKLTEEVARCHQNCVVLEEENAKLREALNELAARFAMLTTVLTSKEAVLGHAGPIAAESAQISSPGVGATEFLTPGPYSAASSDGPGGEASAEAPAESSAGAAAARENFPSVPDFPFPGASSNLCLSPAPSATLSLAEALQRTPQRTPLSLAASLTPTLSPEPFLRNIGGLDVFMFSFTLRKADGADLGLNVTHHETDRVLRIEGITPGGAVEAWNKQCQIGDKAVIPGDKIVSVNSVTYDPAKMLEECKGKQLLKLTIVRGEGPLPTLPVPAPAKATTLRADASVFVPMSGAVEEPSSTPAAAAAPTTGPAEVAAGGAAQVARAASEAPAAPARDAGRP